MSLPISLKAVLDALGPFSDGWYVYVNRKTGEIVAFNEEEAMSARGADANAPDWLREQLPQIRAALSSPDYVELPGQFDFNEYHVMERFCLSLDADALRERLLNAIRGRGAFRRFKNAIDAADLWPAWDAYRDQAVRDLMVGFFDTEDIAYVDDLQSSDISRATS